MATAAKQNSTKWKKHKRGIFCFILGCCGSSSAEVRSSSESKLAKYQRYAKPSALPVVINPKTLSEDVVISSGREIHVVRAEEGRDNPDAPFEVQISKGSKGLSKLRSPRRQSDDNKKNKTVREGRNNKTSKLSHLVSLPQSKKEKVMEASAYNIRKEYPKTRELDPMVGAVIALTAQLVMLIWGKECAIFFTVACVLVVTRLRVSMFETYATTTSSDDDKNHGHLVESDLWEYKKTAALQENNVRD